MAAAHAALLGAYRLPGAARTVYAALLGSGLAASLAAIAFVVLRRPAALYADNHGRAVGPFLNPNEFAQYLLAYLGAAAGLAMIRRGSLTGRFATLCALVAVVALVLTFSRWGAVAAGAGIVAFATWTRPRAGLPIAGMVLAAGVAVNVIFASLHHEPQDTASRAVAWRAGVTTWLHFPLTGVGPLAFERLYPVMRAPDAPGADTPVAFDPHDVPLSILAETGVLGFAAFVAMVATFFRRLLALTSAAPSEGRTLALATAAGIVAVLVHQLLNSTSIGFGLILEFSALALAAASWGYDEGHAV
jgi:O-antigen ligase